MTVHRILLSAREPGAAQMIGPLCRALSADGRFAVELVAQGAALEALTAMGLQPTPVGVIALEHPEDEEREALFRAAGTIVDAFAPDVVITGLSGPGVGIDEALLHLCGDRAVFSVQDYEGWVVRGFGRPAPVYFVADEHAARLTRRVEGVEPVVVGDLKYAGFADLDIPALRAEGRALAPSGRPLVTFYGQPAWGYAGYRETLEILSRAAGQLPDLCFLYRPHPKETETEREMLSAMFEAEGVTLTRCPAGTVEGSIALTDTVVSVFSTVGADHVNLQRAAPSPIGTAVYLLFEPAIRALLEADSGAPRPNVVERGLAHCVERPDTLVEVLRACARPEAARASWRHINEAVCPAERPGRQIIDSIIARLGANGPDWP